MSIEVELTLNGAATTIECEPHDTLLSVLRRLGLISVRYGSDTGETGASAVLIDGRLVNTDCLLAATGASLLALVSFQGGLDFGSAAAIRDVTPRGELHALEQETIRVFETTAPSVVHITSVTTVARSGWGFRVEPREVITGSGSGFGWDDSGHVVTNYHVVRDAVMVDREAVRGEHVAWVTFGEETTEKFRATLVGIAGYKDLAVLKVEAPKR